MFNIYTIKFSDSLWSIAKKCYGFDSNSDIQKGVFAIAGANEDLKNIDYLIVGKKLRIPKEKNFDFYYQNYVSYLRMRRGFSFQQIMLFNLAKLSLVLQKNIIMIAANG